ncbi:MAG: hypothetical protein AB3X44_17850 [Leptothrix sp. (in: b-proteobacteria)]
MHPGNLSFTGAGRPWALAPAYDMLPMGFAPTAGVALPGELAPPVLRPVVLAETWRRALVLAEAFLERVGAEGRWSERWGACVDALERYMEAARRQIGRMG